MEIAGNIIMILGVIFILFGVLGIFKFNEFYARILIISKIDTVGIITLILGLIVKHGISFFSLKLILLMAILIIVNPLISHAIARSAYMSGYRPGDGKIQGENNQELSSTEEMQAMEELQAHSIDTKGGDSK